VLMIKPPPLLISPSAAVEPGWTGWPHFSGGAIFVSAMLLICGATVFMGLAAPLHSAAHDMFFLLDSAYRVAQGQIPHRDFSSAWGPLIYLIYAGGLVLSGMQPVGIAYANAIFGCIIAIWAFLVTRTRWTSASACFVGLYTILLVTAPSSLGSDPRDFSYAMSYNRYGYAIFGIIVMECASAMIGCTATVASIDARVRQSTKAAVSTGFALGLLTFLKISYGMVAALLVASSLVVIGTGRTRRLIGICAGFVALTLLTLCYLRFDLLDMLQDLAIAAAGRRESLRLLHSISLLDLMQAISILAFVGWKIRLTMPRAGSLVSGLGEPLFAVMTVIAGYLLLVSNQQSDSFPLNGYAAVALAAEVGGRPSAKAKSPGWPDLPAEFMRLLLLSVCCLPLFMQNEISWVAACRERLWPSTPNVISLSSTGRGAELSFRSATVPTETTGAEYVEAVDDGLGLIRRHSTPRDGVLTFDEFNPFNYLLDRPSPTGGFAAAAYNYIFSDAAHPSAERFFGNTRYLMVRKYKKANPDAIENDKIEVEDVRALMRIYGRMLQSWYFPVEETDHWVLWEKRAP
jgi:hypothetical protein